MAQIWIMGELLAEIMRSEPGTDLSVEGVFRGPFPSGAPAIFIDTAARLGHSTGIIGGVGNDAFGDVILRRLERDGVDCRLVNRSDRVATGVAFVAYFNNGDRKFMFHMGNSAAVEVVCPDIRELGNVEYLHVMGCSLMSNPVFAQEILKLVDEVCRIGAKISFDPNIRAELLKDASVFEVVKSVLASAGVFLPGEEELLLISGEKTLEDAVEKCFENPNLEVLALKRGSRGCTVYTRNNAYSMGAYSVEAVDATGVGDCFDAAFLCGLLENRSVEEAMKMAAAAGALNTAAFGPMEGTISPESLRKMIETGG